MTSRTASYQRLVWAAACLMAAVMISGTHSAAQSRNVARLTAIAIPPGTSGPPTPVDFVIERWSTPAENDRLMAALTELGTKGVMATLLKFPRVGSFATTGAAGYPIRYAWRVKTLDGLDRITLATDRMIGFLEASEQSRTTEYPVTLVDIRLMPSGTGEGQVFIAAKVGMDRMTRTVTVENYDHQPLLLKNVKEQK